MSTKPLQSCQIFYLEDDYYLAADTKATLVEAGAEVFLCGNVPSALQLVSSRHYDIALLDLDLAGETSVPVARDLDQANVPFVFLTGYSRSVLPEDLSSRPFLTKPSDGRSVVQELEHQLKLSGAHDGHTGCIPRP